MQPNADNLKKQSCHNHTADESTKSDDLNETCRACRQADFILLEEGPHIAKRCRNCGKWLRWVTRTSENLSACEKPSPVKPQPALFTVPHQAKPEPVQPIAGVCDHRAELDRLIHHLRGIESHLSIVTRALMNGGVR